MLLLLGAGRASDGSAGKARFGCYDVRGRLEPTIVTKSEFEVRECEWRELR